MLAEQKLDSASVELEHAQDLEETLIDMVIPNEQDPDSDIPIEKATVTAEPVEQESHDRSVEREPDTNVPMEQERDSDVLTEQEPDISENKR